MEGEGDRERHGDRERDRASYGYIKRLDMTKNRHFEFEGTTKETSIK